MKNNSKNDIVDIAINGPMSDKTIWKSDSDIGKAYGDMVKYLYRKPNWGCLYPGCGEKPISSHSIQASKIQKKLCDNNNTVVSFQPVFSKERLSVTAKYIGVHEASTSPMFCKKHDASLFYPIENYDVDVSNELHLFLYSYRAFIKGFYDKMFSFQASIDGVEKLKQVLNYNEDKPLSDYPTLMNEIKHSYGFYLGYFNQLKIKNVFDYAFEHNKYDVLNFKTKDIPYEISFAVCSSFTPNNDFDGDVINDYIADDEPPKFVFMNMFPENGKSYLLISYLDRQKKYLNTYTESLISESNYKDRLSEIILRYTDNFIVAPTYWNSISDAKRIDLLRFFSDTINNKEISYYPNKHNLFEVGNN